MENNLYLELDKANIKLQQATDNLDLVRQGIAKGEFFDEKMANNALFLVEDRLTEIQKELDSLVEQLKTI